MGRKTDELREMVKQLHHRMAMIERRFDTLTERKPTASGMTWKQAVQAYTAACQSAGIYRRLASDAMSTMSSYNAGGEQWTLRDVDGDILAHVDSTCVLLRHNGEWLSPEEVASQL